MKKQLLAILFGLLGAVAFSQSSIIFSQYIETNSGSTPKGVEILNVSGSDIVLSASNFIQVHQGTNGGSCNAIAATKITSGTLKANEVWVIGTSDLTAFAVANGSNLSGTTTYGFTFNGDDALELYLGVTKQDEFGTCGIDPGSRWSGNGVNTNNNNLEILDNTCDGDLDGWSDPSSRFNQIANGSTMTGFGSVSYTCGAISSFTVTFDANGGTGTMASQASSSAASLTTNSFTYTGYTFDSWNTVADGSGTSYADGAPYAFTADLTLYAQWVTASSCNVTSVIAASPSACAPATGTYSVDVTLTYIDEPASGNLEVNGQSFAITGSPQTVSLSGLVADGNPVDVTVSFSDETSCTLSEAALFTAPAGCAPDIVINEFLADPDATNGDANGDGTVNTQEDEFVEFYNNEAFAVDMSGWTIADNIDIRHTFPANTIVPAGGFITVFGGGTPNSISGITQIANGYQNILALNNGGDTIILTNNNGLIVFSTGYGSEGGDNQSLGREPDLTGSFVKHTTICGVLGRLHSPGEFNVVATPSCNITSSAADMCQGDTRILTSDSPGTVFSGTGVAGNVFTAPNPGASSADFTITATNGCCSSTQIITVDSSPFAANAGEDKPACINNTATLSASNPPVGSGTWTWSPSAPTYAGGTSASDYNAQVVFNAVGQYTGTWTVTNGICTSTPDDAVVTVTSANNNASLFASAGAATESIFAFEVCEEGPWTYYAASGSPDEYLFAINKNGNLFSAEVSITDLPSTTTIASLGGSPAIRGTWLIGRYWNATILSGSITTPVDIRFFVDPAEVTQAENEATSFLNSTAAATNMTSLTFFKTVSAAFDPSTSVVNGEFTFAPAYLPYTTGTLNGVTYYELTGLTSFSGGTGGFSVNDSGSPLPVELLGFDVNAVDNQFIRLDWATASEINNEGFEVLRSTNGVNFERIAWIDGNGNSTEINEYVFNDWGVDKGMTYYYQLKQIDYDGQNEYFDIKSARLDGKTTFTVGALVPNPSKGNDMVSVDVSTSSGELLTVEIYDRIGAKVKSTSYVLFAAENALDINIADLAEGTYFLNFESSMGTETRKLVVLK